MPSKTAIILDKIKKGDKPLLSDIISAVNYDISDLDIAVDRLTQVASETLEAVQRLTILVEQHIDVLDDEEIE